MEKLHFKICIEGDLMAQQTINFSISVKAVSTPLALVDANGQPLTDGQSVALASETVGVADSQVLFTVSGGVPPYNFAISSGALPDGDTLQAQTNSDGSETVSLEGTPTTAGDSTFAVTVSDSAGASQSVGAKKTVG